MKNATIFLLFLAVCSQFFGCKKEFVPSKFELILVEGGGQSGSPNQKLEKEIVIAVLRDGKPFFSAPIEVRVNSGFVNFSSPINNIANIGSTDANGRLRLSWFLGCLDGQEMTIILRSPGCSALELSNETCLNLQEINVKVNTNVLSGWRKACGLDNVTNFFSGNSKFSQFGEDIFLLNGNNPFVSSNNGSDWEVVNTPFGVNVNFTSAFTADPQGNWYMAMFSSGIFISTNRGNTWTSISSNIFFSQPTNIRADGNKISVSDANNGLVQTLDGGQTWNQSIISGGSFGFYSEIVVTNNNTWWMWDNQNVRFVKSTDEGQNFVGQNVASTLTAFPASFLKTTADNHLLYLYEAGAKLNNYDPATNTGTSKQFSVSPFDASRVGSLNIFDGKIYLNIFDFNGQGTIYSDDGSGTNFQKVDLGTSEIPNEFFITEAGKFLLGTNNGLFVKSN